MDYILCNRLHLQVHQSAQSAQDNITDHDLLYTHLPIMPAQAKTDPITQAAATSTPGSERQPEPKPARQERTVCKWLQGDDI